jgi:hypothetical protein
MVLIQGPRRGLFLIGKTPLYKWWRPEGCGGTAAGLMGIRYLHQGPNRAAEATDSDSAPGTTSTQSCPRQTQEVVAVLSSRMHLVSSKQLCMHYRGTSTIRNGRHKKQTVFGGLPFLNNPETDSERSR